MDSIAKPHIDLAACRLLCFGMLSDLPGIPVGEIPHFPDTDAFTTWLQAQCPELKSMVYALALNREIVQENRAIPAGSELALLPPFSGG